MRFAISYAGLPSSLVAGFDLQQQVSGTAEPSLTIGEVFGGLEPHAATTTSTTNRAAIRLRMLRSYHRASVEPIFISTNFDGEPAALSALPSSAGVPVSTGNVPKCIGITVFALTSFVASAARAGPIVK